MAYEPDTVGDVSQILRMARVVSVDRAQATCIVAVGDPDGDGEVESDGIPWMVAKAGETIVWSPPSEGEQGLLLCPDGDIAQGVFLAGAYSTQFPAPDDGTRHFVRFADDAEFGYDPASSKADVTLPTGGELTIIAAGGVTIEGNVTILGDVEVEGAVQASGDVIGDGISLSGHTHSGVQSGGSSTGDPQ
jgi:phage baseplate assembly protein V